MAERMERMKIEFLTEEDALYILPFFEEFLRNFSPKFEILQVSCCPVMGSRPRKQLLKELTWLYGVAGFSRLLTRYLTSRALSWLPRGRNARRFHSIAQACAAYSVPYRKIGNPNSEKFLTEVRERGADLIVSVACPYILKRTLLQLPPKGCVNLHHAPLPRYKGMMPTFWQLYHGESTVGLTIHWMVEKIDEGQALLQESLAVRPGETLDHLIRRSKRQAAHSLATVLHDIEAGTSNSIALEREGATYFTFPNREQIKEFHRRGLRAI